MSFGTIRRVFAALEARLECRATWHAGELDRLVDQRHAAIVESVVRTMRALGWEVRPEVSLARTGNRGSIDVFAWHTATRAVLLLEVKSEIYSVEETLRRFQGKIQLASVVAREQLGWAPWIVGSALVLPESAGIRRRLAAHSATFAAAFPDRGRELRAWLQRPERPLAAIWFLSTSDLVRALPRTVRRVRVPARAGRSETTRNSPGHGPARIPAVRAIPDRRAEFARAGFIADRWALAEAGEAAEAGDPGEVGHPPRRALTRAPRGRSPSPGAGISGPGRDRDGRRGGGSAGEAAAGRRAAPRDGRS